MSLNKNLMINVIYNDDNSIIIDRDWMHYHSVNDNASDYIIDSNEYESYNYVGVMSNNLYFSFINEQNNVSIQEKKYMDNNFADNHGYFENKIEEIINDYSLIVYKPHDIRNDKLNFTPPVQLYKFYQTRFKNYLPSKIFYVFEKFIKDEYKELSEAFDEYMNGTSFFSFLSFIMDNSTYDYYTKVLSGAIKKVESKIDIKISNVTKTYKDFLAKTLLGIFVCYIEKVKIIDAIVFENTTKQEEIFPAFEKNNVAFATVSSNFYVPYLSVWLKSIISNITPENNYDIIVFESQITDNNKCILRNMVDGLENVSLRFVNPEPLLNDATFFVSNSSYCQEAYYRVFSPWLLKNYKKIVITDCDIIATADVADLYNENVDDYYIGAVKDIIYQGLLSGDVDRYSYTKNEMGMTEPYDYINTGVMILNLEKIRQFYLLDYVIAFCQEHKFKIQEQDAINVLFEGKIMDIDLCWNYYVNMNKWVTNCLNMSPIKAKLYYDECGESPKLIHFANNPKPWVDPDIPYAEDFWKYAQQSPFYELILFRMTQSKNSHPPQKKVPRANPPKKTIKQQIQDKIIKPVINGILPIHSIRREYTKEMIKKVRGKPNRFTVVNYFRKQYSLLKKNQRLTKYSWTLAGDSYGKISELKDKYKGQRCFFVGLGPSLQISDLEKLRSEATFAVNNVFSLYENTDWRPTFYLNQETIAMNSDYINDFSQKRFSMCDPSISFFPLNKHSKKISKVVKNAIFLPIVNDWTMYYKGELEFDTFSKDVSKEVHGAFVSMYSCLQIAAYLGFTEIILIGCDGKYTVENPHCYARTELDDKIIINKKAAEAHTTGINKGFIAMKKAADQNGIKIYNATRGGYLEVFPRINFDDAI